MQWFLFVVLLLQEKAWIFWFIESSYEYLRPQHRIKHWLIFQTKANKQQAYDWPPWRKTMSGVIWTTTCFSPICALACGSLGCPLFLWYFHISHIWGWERTPKSPDVHFSIIISFLISPENLCHFLNISSLKSVPQVAWDGWRTLAIRTFVKLFSTMYFQMCPQIAC